MRIFHYISPWSIAREPDDETLLSALLCAEEAVKYALNIIEMIVFDVAASFEVITEHRRACTAHHAKLLAQIRQVFYLRRLSLSPLRHLGGATQRSAKYIA